MEYFVCGFFCYVLIGIVIECVLSIKYDEEMEIYSFKKDWEDDIDEERGLTTIIWVYTHWVLYKDLRKIRLEKLTQDLITL